MWLPHFKIPDKVDFKYALTQLWLKLNSLETFRKCLEVGQYHVSKYTESWSG